MFSERRVWRIVFGTLVMLPLLAVTSASTSIAASARPQPPKFDPRAFAKSTKIGNRWYPLVPGTQFILDGKVNLGSRQGLRPHRVVLTVTDLTKVINGVRSMVLWDRDVTDGQLKEAELAFEAQDNSGNVWNLGEYPEEYKNGKFDGASNTWIAGVAGARAGFAMLANPWVGTPSYVQGSTPAIGFLDVAKVSQTGQRICVPVKCYQNVLVIDETSPLDPESGHQLKYYAPGVGNIRIGAVGGQQQEFLALTKIVNLNDKTLAQARAEALKLDQHAYQVSNIYRHTPPVQRRR